MDRFFQLLALAAMYVDCSAAPTSSQATSSCKVISHNATKGCGIRGYLNFDASYGFVDDFAGLVLPETLDSLEACAEVLFRHSSSQGYGKHKRDPAPPDYYAGNFYEYTRYTPFSKSLQYNSKLKLCQLGQESDLKAVVADPSADSVFYNQACFSCGSYCPATYGQQLLDNGGFEGTIGPWTSGQDGELAKGDDSRQSYSCPVDGTCYLGQNVNFCNNTLYSISFDFRAVPAPSKPKQILHFLFGRNGHEVFPDFSFFAVTSNSNWNTATAYYYFDASSSLVEKDQFGPQFEFGYSGSTGYLDNVVVAAVPSNPAKAPGASSVIQNGGFENGFASWSILPGVDANFTLVSPGISGKHAVQHQQTTTKKDEAGLSQNVTTTAGSTYLFSVEGLVTKQSFEVGFVLTSFGGSAAYYDYYWNPGPQSFSIPFVAPTNLTNIQFFVRDDYNAYQGFHNGTVTLDNFSLVELKKTKYFP